MSYSGVKPSDKPFEKWTLDELQIWATWEVVTAVTSGDLSAKMRSILRDVIYWAEKQPRSRR